MDNLRSELSAIMERSRMGDRKQYELEQMVTRLEDEISRYSSQNIQLEERLADKMSHVASMEEKLGQRNLRIVDLQKELEGKITEINELLRDVSGKIMNRHFIYELPYFNMTSRTLGIGFQKQKKFGPSYNYLRTYR